MAARGERKDVGEGAGPRVRVLPACPCGCADAVISKAPPRGDGRRADEVRREVDREVRVMRALAGRVGVGGAPRVHAVVGRPPAIVMDYLGRDLFEAVRAGGGRAPWPTVAAWGRSALARLRALHELGYVHRDIKPENLVERPGGEVALIDFGLCRPWRLLGSGHVPRRDGCDPAGTPRFMSPWSAAGTTPSRRDDLASLVYTLAFLLRGRLPWQGVYTAASRPGGHAAGAAALLRSKLERGTPAALCARGSDAAPLRRLADQVWGMSWAGDPRWGDLALALSA